MTIIVTGANRGLGFELVRKFAEEGHNVAACYYPKSSKDELDALAVKYGDQIMLVPVDVTSEQDVVRAAEAIRERFMQADAVISNAGVLCDGDRVNDLLGWILRISGSLWMSIFSDLQLSSSISRLL